MQITNVQSFALRALVAFAVLAGAFAGGYMLGLRNASVPSDSAGADRTAEQLDQAAGAQQRLTTDLRDATESAGRLSDRIGAGAGAVDRGRKAVHGAAESADSIDRKIDESRRLIDSSERILERVLGRAKADQAPH